MPATKEEMSMRKIDYKKELKHLYKPSAGKVNIVEVPQMNFFMIDGEEDPNTSQSFQDAVNVLYPLSYTDDNATDIF